MLEVKAAWNAPSEEKDEVLALQAQVSKLQHEKTNKREKTRTRMTHQNQRARKLSLIG